MKLRNKKTGGLATLEVHEDCLTLKTDAGRHDYNSLAELNEEWEDYEKPKHDYYFIRLFPLILLTGLQISFWIFFLSIYFFKIHTPKLLSLVDYFCSLAMMKIKN